jgi:transcriptional regulator of NAD metabolism
MLDGTERRRKILHQLENASEPISGTALSKMFNVSRQVVVQDIALLRATNKNIISTTKGYLVYKEDTESVKRVFQVLHSSDQIEDELNTFVDRGGKVLDVVVEHEIYGSISVDLILNNRSEVKEFVEKCNACNASPLMGLTKGKHYHTVAAQSEQVLDAIGQALSEKGYLIS